MENRPVINITARNISPGVDDETIKRYSKWNSEAYAPLLLKVSGIAGIDHYDLNKKSPQYPPSCSIQHYESIAAWENSINNPERRAVNEDLNAWVKRGVREGVWSASYEMVQGFRAGTTYPGIQKDTRIENASFMHLEAYIMTQDEWEKYNKWFAENGRVFIPLFMKTCGLKGYDFLKHSGFAPTAQAREKDYPVYISILYFEDQKAFEHFEDSPEQVSFQSALRNIFPLGLNYKWYVQYRLRQSWRK